MRENIAAVMAGVFNRGFERVTARNSVYDENGKVIYDKGTRLQRFLSIFSENKEAFAVSQNTFVMSVHQTGPRCRRIPYQQNTQTFSSRHVPLLLTHNALGLGLHRQPSDNHYISPVFKK